MESANELERGRESFRRQAWRDAFTHLASADERAPLGPEDLESLGIAAFLLAKNADSIEVLGRAYHSYLTRGDGEPAAMCAYRIGMQLMEKGDMAQAGGWFARAQRALDDGGLDSVVRGYLLTPVALKSLFFEGDPALALRTFEQMAGIAGRYGDADLMALSRLGRGRALIGLGRTEDGVASLDEAMLAVTTREVSPITAGIVYCGTIEACQEIFDLRRAQEWTAALSRWCDTQPDLVPYRGQCLLHRSQIMQLHGAWRDALDEAQRAQRWLSEPPAPALGGAYYQLAEIHRLRGSFGEAEEAYREASNLGRNPQPGLALLRLAQGQINAAEATIRRVVNETQDPISRSKVLPAHVEIMLEVNDVSAARAAADELMKIADGLDAPLLRAIAAHAKGAVLISEGDPATAIPALRQAWAAWQEIDAPYEAARVRVLIGLACRELGDQDTAELELDAARRTFEQLGAAPELARLAGLSVTEALRAPGGLTARELEVLRLVAAGKTNRAIAQELVLSDKTIARHVSNIFTKLGVSSRSAATAFAYEQGLV